MTTATERVARMDAIRERLAKRVERIDRKLDALYQKRCDVDSKIEWLRSRQTRAAMFHDLIGKRADRIEERAKTALALAV